MKCKQLDQLILERKNKYKFTGQLNKENIFKFLEDWENNKFERFLKTEDEPEKNDEPI